MRYRDDEIDDHSGESYDFAANTGLLILRSSWSLYLLQAAKEAEYKVVDTLKEDIYKQGKGVELHTDKGQSAVCHEGMWGVFAVCECQPARAKQGRSIRIHDQEALHQT